MALQTKLAFFIFDDQQLRLGFVFVNPVAGFTDDFTALAPLGPFLFQPRRYRGGFRHHIDHMNRPLLAVGS